MGLLDGLLKIGASFDYITPVQALVRGGDIVIPYSAIPGEYQRMRAFKRLFTCWKYDSMHSWTKRLYNIHNNLKHL